MSSAQTLLRQLRQVRATFGEPAEQHKRETLRQLSACRLLTVRELTAYHEDLLFIVAFPGSVRTRVMAVAELACFSRRWRGLAVTVRDAARNSGMAGTVTRPSLAWPVVLALGDEDLDVEWPNLEVADAFDALVARLVSPAERDAFEGGDYTTRAWIRLAKRADERDATWLIREASASRPQSEVASSWDAAQVPLRWNLGDSRRSITHARLAVRRPTLLTGFRRLTEAAAGHVMRPLEGIQQLPRREAARVVDLARSALAARAREVHAMNYPNLAEVYQADLGEGVHLVLIGVPFAQRLTLEANYGYLMLSNGVPIGYGGVSPLYRQANTGINIFDPFRGSEAAFLWAQTLRVFRTLFGARRFVINGYQFGAGNSEAIASGAYWFYYRLGFRPSIAENVGLAAEELDRLRRQPNQRTQASVLRRLARGDLHVDLPDFDARDFFEEPLLTRIGAAVARRIATLGTRSHQAGEQLLVRTLQETLGVRDTARWSTDERRGFARLAPYAALLDVEAWPTDERRALAQWLRTKGGAAEREFAVQATEQTRFFAGLRAAADQELKRAAR
jgi:hypothetical protein